MRPQSFVAGARGGAPSRSTACSKQTVAPTPANPGLYETGRTVSKWLAVIFVAVGMAAGAGAEEVQIGGKTIELADTRFGKLQRLHKKHPEHREAIDREYASRCNPAKIDRSDRSLSDLERRPRRYGSANEPGSYESAAVQNLGNDVAKAVEQTTIYRQSVYCAAMDRVNSRRAHFLRYKKRLDALMFYGLDEDRARRIATNDDLYEVELARLQRDQ